MFEFPRGNSDECFVLWDAQLQSQNDNIDVPITVLFKNK